MGWILKIFSLSFRTLTLAGFALNGLCHADIARVLLLSDEHLPTFLGLILGTGEQSYLHAVLITPHASRTVRVVSLVLDSTTGAIAAAKAPWCGRMERLSARPSSDTSPGWQWMPISRTNLGSVCRA